MRGRHGDLKSNGGEKVFQSVAIRAGSREEETRRKLTAFGTCLCHGLCDSGLACTCRPVKPQELRGTPSSPDPPLNFAQYLRASPRMTSRGREPFLGIISGTRGDPLRERLQEEVYPKREFRNII
jgi:hypothetical protein